MQKISGQKNSNCLFKQKFGTKTYLNMRNSMMMFTFSLFDYEYLMGKFGSKIQNCLFKFKFDTKTNSKMQNSMVVSILSVLD